ncbi:hypothetical protein RclHR1_02850013 [Rhizophagus clarus]|uniref:AIG1-type G domain-containing protein n=1 Tax=Rhizophagus clarus TaxID=94130 RepID=A0A2Z6R7H1_9GLOM|nr:hypothetical protein RclHR1_02850013 [Rhizophagus clarus]
MGIKNLLIVGCTTCGKSTLANVLCGKRTFDENESTIRNSRDFQEEKFFWKGIEYHVVDIRVVLDEKKILYKIGRVICSMPEGIRQVLFVVDQRLTAEESEKLKKIDDFILKIGIKEFTTIVRTKFENFKIVEKCKDDKDDFCQLNDKIFEHTRIIHVDNPPTHILKNDDDETIENNERKRIRSRNKLLNHLENVCSERYFKLKNWDKLVKSKHLKNLNRFNIENIDNLFEYNKLTRLSVSDYPKLTTLDCSTNGLTNLKISGCSRLKDITNLSKAPKLVSLSLIYCPNRTKLDCSSTEKLIELTVIELNCSNTSINILSVNLCPDIQRLNCSNNDKLINLDISNCKKLVFLDCSNSNLTSLDISNCKSLFGEYEQNGIKSKDFKYPPNLKIIRKIIAKNLIIVGRTGGGKSTLSNVLTGTTEFEESGRVGVQLASLKISRKKILYGRGKILMW